MNIFEKLNNINVNEHTEKKNNLTYLSWAWAWAEFCKVFPTAEYEVYKNEKGLPYVYDENTGYMVYVKVRVEEEGKTLEHEMWLPVMDNQNNAMKSAPYVKKTKYKEVTVDAATMFDVNKTIMRCLVKCLAMFGLGLYIYAGEDLPEDESQDTSKSTDEMRAEVKKLMAEKKVSMNEVLEISKYDDFNDFDEAELTGCINWLRRQEG